MRAHEIKFKMNDKIKIWKEIEERRQEILEDLNDLFKYYFKIPHSFDGIDYEQLVFGLSKRKENLEFLLKIERFKNYNDRKINHTFLNWYKTLDDIYMKDRCDYSDLEWLLELIEVRERYHH